MGSSDDLGAQITVSVVSNYGSFINANVDLSMIEMNRMLMKNNLMLIVSSQKLKKKSKIYFRRGPSSVDVQIWRTSEREGFRHNKNEAKHSHNIPLHFLNKHAYIQTYGNFGSFSKSVENLTTTITLVRHICTSTEEGPRRKYILDFFFNFWLLWA